MLRMLLIRHSMTAGNLKKRYIGTTDEPLCPEGVELIRQVFYPQVEAVFVSPMRRCVETAGIIYPNRRLHIIDELAECDFGELRIKIIRNYPETPITRNGWTAAVSFLFREAKAGKGSAGGV